MLKNLAFLTGGVLSIPIVDCGGDHTSITRPVPPEDPGFSGSFLSEIFGLMAPAIPQTGSKIGLNYTTVAVSVEPAQTTQLFTTMISTAFIEDDIERIIDAGVVSLDPNSKTLKLINDIKKWYSQYPDNWRELRGRLKKKYTQEGANIRDDYWKLMHIIFYNDFKKLEQLRDKTISAGLKKPVKKFSSDELWNSSKIWNNPDSLLEQSISQKKFLVI